MKKRIVIIFGILLGGLLLALGIWGITSSARARSLQVAFYGLEEELTLPIQEKILQAYSGKVQFTTVPQKDFNPKRLAKKYDLVFGWNGNAIEELASYAKDIPSSAKNQIVSSLNAEKSLPLLLNHWEVNFQKKARTNTGLELPLLLTDYNDYLVAMKNQVFIPFFCAGGDDDTLLAYISVLAEAMNYNDVYTKLTQKIRESSSLKEVLSGSDDAATCMKFILEHLKEYVSQNLSVENWINATQKDIEVFTAENQIGVLFTSLLNHRKIEGRYMNQYESSRMAVIPTDSTKTVHGLIAPYICAVDFSKKNMEPLLNQLVSEDVQSYLSDVTKLAPVNSKCMAYDVQADDLRFFAAIAPAGALPDMANACFQTDLDRKKKFAEEVRIYLSSSTEK